MCLSLDMTPLRLDTVLVKSALASFANGNFNINFCHIFKIATLLTVSTWKGLHNFWTAGCRSEITSRFQWCSLESSVELTKDVPWQKGQPDNLGGQQNCLHLKFTNVSTTMISDRNCTSKFPFACQVQYKMKKIILCCCKKTAVFTLKNYLSESFTTRLEWMLHSTMPYLRSQCKNSPVYNLLVQKVVIPYYDLHRTSFSLTPLNMKILKRRLLVGLILIHRLNPNPI
jgi:hypothetical protein